MNQRYAATARASSTASFLGIVIVVMGILHACGSRSQLEIRPAGDSFLPLAEGNMWIFETRSENAGAQFATAARDTVEIDRVVDFDGQRYYRIHANWPDLVGSRWLTRVPNGDVYWTESPGQPLYPYLLFSRSVGDSWSTGLATGCLGMLQMSDDYAVAETPYGRFDGVHMIGTTAQECGDSSWALSVARGVGPVQWMSSVTGGAEIRELVSARVRDDVPLKISPPLSRIMNED